MAYIDYTAYIDYLDCIDIRYMDYMNGTKHTDYVLCFVHLIRIVSV